MPPLLLTVSTGCTHNSTRSTWCGCSSLLFIGFCCCTWLHFSSCSQLQWGSTRMSQHQKALCPAVSEKKNTFTLSSLCLSASYIHPAWAWLLLDSSFQQCFTSEPQPTQQNTADGNFSLLSGSVFVSNTRSPLSYSSCLHLSFPHQHNLHLSLRTGDLTQHPRGSDFIRRQLQSRPQSQVLVGRPIITATVSGMPVWDRWRTSPTSASHLGTPSFTMCICEFHLSVVSAEGMSTCVVWEIKCWDRSRPLSARPPKYWQTGSAFLRKPLIRVYKSTRSVCEDKTLY